MAYGSEIDALLPDHRWSDSVTDQVGSVTGTATGMTTGSAICEDASSSLRTTAIANSRISLPTTTTINNAAHTRKSVGGWFSITKVNAHPTSIYGEGIESLCFRIIMAYGNNTMFEVVQSGTIYQLYGIPLLADRAYHLYAELLGSAYGSTLKFYIDGVLQDSVTFSSASLAARAVGEFADPAGTVGVGGVAVTLQAPVYGQYNHWAMWANKTLPTATEVRTELFEKGALPTITIASDTAENMQAALEAYDNTTHANAPLSIRIEDVVGSGNLILTATNQVFDDNTSIHIQWMGTGMLAFINAGTTNASISSKPNGGIANFITARTVKVVAKSATDLSVISGARVLVVASAGGPATEGAEIMNTITDENGAAIVADYLYYGSQPVTVTVRKGSTAPYYKPALGSGTITTNGLSMTILCLEDD